MSNPIRFTLAVVAGAISAFILVWAVDAIGHQFYAPPVGLDLSDTDQLGQYIAGLPVGAFLFVLLAWVVATFVGGLVACVIAGTRPLLFAGIIGGVILIAGLANMLTIPHPLWFAIVAIVAIPAAALAAARVAPKVIKATAR
jgi:hypothetical protein